MSEDNICEEIRFKNIDKTKSYFIIEINDH